MQISTKCCIWAHPDVCSISIKTLSSKQIHEKKLNYLTEHYLKTAKHKANGCLLQQMELQQFSRKMK